MFGLGVTELVIILVIVVVLFGARRLPEIGKGIGEAMGEFLTQRKCGYENYSLFAQAYRGDVPVTVHVAFGTDIFISRVVTLDARSSHRPTEM